MKNSTKKGRGSMINKPMLRRDDTLPHRQVSVEVVVPVYNEEKALAQSIPALCAYLETYFPYRWSVVIADNASTDTTLSVAENLAAANPRVSVLHLEEKGRGRALKAAWLASEADVVAYMDVDLSTNLWSFLPLVAPLATGHSDVAIGSRLLRGAMVTRQWKREVISRCYNLLIKTLFGNRFSDAQCGFKAIKCGAAQALLPQVEDNEWFFDTELLLLAEERCLRISEVPVDWIEDLDSRVDVASTALKDVKGLLRVRAQRLRRRFIERWFPEASNVAHHARSWRLIGERPPRLAKQAGREVEPGVVEVEVGDGRARIRAAG
jgi:glycosyltransferase involved in cell wall biosynthesis